MKTRIFKLNEGIDYVTDRCAEILSKGGIVIFPTETVYGIGADAFNLDAVNRIFEVKGRKKDNPLIFHISHIETLYELAELPDNVKKIADEFMPGPLTLVLKSKVDKKYTFGLDTIAVRMPDNLIAIKLIKKLSSPIVAPSANISGRPSGTEFTHVLDDFDGKVEAIIDGGKTVFGVESTVIDVTVEPFLLLRAGAVSLDELAEKGVNVSIPESVEVLKRSPGTRYKHYAPEAAVIPFETETQIRKLLEKFSDKKVALLGTSRFKGRFFKTVIFDNISDYARLLYSTFRYMDAAGVDVIFAQLPENKGLGLAIRDRIIRASQG